MGKYVDEAGLTRVVSQTKELVAASQKVATSSTPGIVKPDGANISVTSDGTISLSDGGVTEAKLSEDVKTKINNSGVNDGSITYQKLANPMILTNDYTCKLDGNIITYETGSISITSGLNIEGTSININESSINMDMKSHINNNGLTDCNGPARFYNKTDFYDDVTFANASFNALLDVSNGGVKLPENSVTESNLSTDVQKKLNSSNLDGLVDMIYPVGSIYMSVAAVDPSNLFGGTWEKIEGKFIMSSDSSHAAGTTGGSNDAVAVSHTHSASTSSSGSHTHSGESDTDGSHTHSISGGSHSHSGSTSSAGSHSHGTGSSQSFVTSSGRFGYGSGSASAPAPSSTTSSTASGGSHTHSVTVNTSSSHSHSMTSAGGHYHILTIDSAGSHTHTVNVSSSGVDGKNKNMPSFISVNVWKRTA